MVAETPNPNQERAKRIAETRIAGFTKQYGEAHRYLALHGAFPLVLTPDLLYQIWANFVPEAPWTAVAHVLLSRLCRQVGYEMYEIDISDRNLLLRELKAQFEQKRLDELGEFLLDYVAQRLTEDDPDTQDLAQAQEWTALAYTKPTKLARELAQFLNQRVKQDNTGEVLRLASYVETLAEPLVEAGFEPLLIYSRGMVNFVKGDTEAAKNQFSKLSRKGSQVEIAGENLEIPLYFPTPPIIEPGTLVRNRYLVIRQLGEGGFGKTFQVNDNGIYKCLKILVFRDNEYAQRILAQFQQEAELLNQLSHKGIPKGESDGYFTWPENSLEPFHCLVMEFIDGLNLEKWLENNGSISQELALNWLRQITEILDYLHRKKFIHRNIKPGSIILKPDGQLMLTSFTANCSIEGDELCIITYIYSPPEQILGKTVLQSDFFALGRTFIHLLTGINPRRMLESDVDELIWRDAAPQILPELADLIDNLMAISPQKRPQNTEVILKRLDAIDSLVKRLKAQNLQPRDRETRNRSYAKRIIDLPGYSEIRIIGDRSAGKTTYMAGLAYFSNGFPNSPIQTIESLNDDTDHLIESAKYILESSMNLAATYLLDAQNIPYYTLLITLKPRFISNPIASITGKNIRMFVSCKDYPGELIENLCQKPQDNYLWDNYLNDCVFVSGLLLLIDGSVSGKDQRYAQAFTNLRKELKSRLIAQGKKLNTYRIAVVFSKFEQAQTWAYRHRLKQFMSIRFPQTQTILKEWSQDWGCSLAYFACSAFGMMGNPPRPNVITRRDDARGAMSILARPNLWKPFGLVAPIYWLHTGKHDSRLRDI